jgi:hypothetical protein
MGGRGPAAPISGPPGHITGPIPAAPMGSRGPAAPISGPPGQISVPPVRGSGAPISGPPGHITGPIPAAPMGGRGSGAPISGPPSGRAGGVPPMSNERVAQAPQRGPFTASPRSSVAAPPRGRGGYAAAPPPAGPAAAPAAPPGMYGTRSVPSQRRRAVETDQGYGGRRTLRPNSPHSAPPGHSTYGEPLSSARLAALAAQETVIQHVVVDPVAAPAPVQRPEPRRKSGNGVRIAAVILMVVAVLAGIALAAIGVMVAG